jgi:hypothetical protein
MSSSDQQSKQKFGKTYEDGKDTKFVRLSAHGAQQYQNLQYAGVKQFIFWFFVGNCGGFVFSKFIEMYPLKSVSPSRLKRLRLGTYFAFVIGMSYHGYKLSRFTFLKEKKALLANPENVLEEPDGNF